MAQSVLIVEDEEGVGKAIAEVCTSLGLETTIAKRGDAAVAAFDARQPDLITLDLLLPGGMDGRKVAEAIRAKPGGEEIPILVISGFIKDPKAQQELTSKFGVKTFILKPLQADDLRAAIAAPLGIKPAPATTPQPQAAVAPAERAGMDSFEVSLQMRPAMALFAELHRNKAEGILELTRGNAKKRFYLQRGFFRYATSNVKAENLAGLLAAKGVAEAKIAEAMALAKSNGLTLGDALVQLKLVPQKDVPALLVQQTEEVAITSYPWADGNASFKAGPSEAGVEGRANPVICVLKAFKRYGNAEDAKRRLSADPKAVLERTPELDREGFAIRGLFPGESVTLMINGRLSVGEILAKAKEPDLLLVHALVAAGLAKRRGAEGAPGGRTVSSPGMPAPAASMKPKRPYTPEEEASREMIREESRRQAGAATHYQVLGVAPNADAAAVKAAYLKLARTFHTDAFAGQELGDMQPALEQVFKRITEANAELGDATQREEYDTILDRKAKGLPTDVGEILKAESSFGRGEALRKAGRLKDAEKMFREAVQGNPGNQNYLITLAKTVLALQGNQGAKEASDLLDKALALGQDSLAAQTLKAQLMLDGGDAKGALELLRKVTAVNPGFENAMDLLRKAKAAAAGGGQEKGSSLLGKLFGNKGK